MPGNFGGTTPQKGLWFVQDGILEATQGDGSGVIMLTALSLNLWVPSTRIVTLFSQMSPPPIPNAATITLANSGAGGRDQAGDFATDVVIFCYWIYNGVTLTAIASLNPPSLGGPTLPTGYTEWAYAGAAITNGVNTVLGFRARGPHNYLRNAINIVNDAAAPTAETQANYPANLLYLASVSSGAYKWLVDIEAGIITNAGGLAISTLRVNSPFNLGATTPGIIRNTRVQSGASSRQFNTKEIDYLDGGHDDLGYFFTNETNAGNIASRSAVINFTGFQDGEYIGT